MDTTPAMDAALSAERLILFVAVEVELPSRTVRVVDGSSVVAWSRGTFSSQDSVAGVLSNIEPVEDGIGDAAPRMIISFNPAKAAGAIEIASANMQNSPIRVWLGALDPATRQVVNDPYLLLDGIIDQPKLIIDRENRVVEYDCVSHFERFFTNDEGLRLSPTSHKEYWPGELGLDAITGVVKQVIWGPGDKISGGSGGGSGGGFLGGLIDITRHYVAGR